jgi:hypothetical protein
MSSVLQSIGDPLSEKETEVCQTVYIHSHVYADINYSIFLRSWFEKQTLTVTETSTMTNSSPLCSRYKSTNILYMYNVREV